MGQDRTGQDQWSSLPYPMESLLVFEKKSYSAKKLDTNIYAVLIHTIHTPMHKSAAERDNLRAIIAI